MKYKNISPILPNFPTFPTKQRQFFMKIHIFEPNYNKSTDFNMKYVKFSP